MELFHKKEIDLTVALKEEHQGKWIVFSPSELKIYSFDEDPEKAIKKAKGVTADDLSLMKVFPFNESFAS